MTRWTNKLALLGLMLVVAVPAIAQDTKPATLPKETNLPEAKTVLAHALEAVGGKDAHSKIVKRMTKAKFKIPAMGMEGATLQYQDGSNNYLEIELPGMGKMRNGITDGVVWDINPMMGPRLVTGDEAASQLRSMRLHSFLDLDKHFKKMECVATRDVNGAKCYKLEMTPNSGNTESWFFDSTNWMLTRVTTKVESPMGMAETSVTMSDYREVDGVKLPFHMKMDQMGQSFEIVVGEVKHDFEIPAGTFELPKEIQALVKKDDAKKEGGAETRPGN